MDVPCPRIIYRCGVTFTTRGNSHFMDRKYRRCLIPKHLPVWCELCVVETRNPCGHTVMDVTWPRNTLPVGMDLATRRRLLFITFKTTSATVKTF